MVKRLGIVLILGLMSIMGSDVGAALHQVEIGTMGFQPPNTVIRPNDTVRWVVVSDTHQIVSDPVSPKSWQSPVISEDSVPDYFDVVFTYSDGQGPFPYHCGIHPGTEKDTIFTTNECVAYGDANGDGSALTGGDMIYLIRHLKGEVALPDPKDADITGNCVLDLEDVELIELYLIYGFQVFPQYPVPTCCYPTACCIGMRGNVDYDQGDGCNIIDVTYLVDYLFTGGPDPVCPKEADVDSDLAVNISDLTLLIEYLFNGGPPPDNCEY